MLTILHLSERNPHNHSGGLLNMVQTDTILDARLVGLMVFEKSLAYRGSLYVLLLAIVLIHNYVAGTSCEHYEHEIL
jgi:hypothetical protein